jgi:PBSX family phage terminase large subunit
MLEITLDDLIISKYDGVLDDILNHKYVHYSFYSGRGATKSSFISVALILLMIQEQNRDVHAVVFRKISNTLRDSVYANIAFAITLLGLDAVFKKTVSPMEITFIKTGQKILFRGIDAPEKIKSIKAPFGYFGITWFEELDQYHGREEIRNVLQSTMRGKGGVFWNFESFNPPVSRSN